VVGVDHLEFVRMFSHRAFEIDVRGKPRTAEVREKPLYRKE